MALPALSVIIAEILTVAFSAKPLISSKSGSTVPASSIVIVTESVKSVSSMVYASPRFPKAVGGILPRICNVPPTRDVSFATSTFTSSAVLTPFQNPLLTGSVTVEQVPTVKSAGTIPSTTIPGLLSTKLLLAGILKTVIGLPALSRMLAPRSKAMVVTSNGTLELGDTNQSDSSPAATKYSPSATLLLILEISNGVVDALWVTSRSPPLNVPAPSKVTLIFIPSPSL